MTLMNKKSILALLFFSFIFLFGLALPLKAYVGPGAGFAFLSSFLVLFITFLIAIFSFISWPFRFILRLIKGQKAYKNRLIDRLIIIGLDGMEPTITEKLLSEGKLPNLSKLKKEGCYARLKTSIPSISPVAWSSFMTGCHPAKHNIFDFLSRNPKTYLPALSSAHIENPKRVFPIGKYNLPLSKPIIKGLRKSIPFWKILGDAGIFSTIIRIPVTFPPEKFHGHLLSGMCAPDLKGSQGTFSFYTSNKERIRKREGGMNIPVSVNSNIIKTYISGPENPILKRKEEIRLPLTIILDREKEEALIEVCKQKIKLKKQTFSDWIKLTFKAGLGVKIKAICRFYILQLHPHFEMYVTPLNIDPEKPALPVSQPFIYSVYLAKLLGNFTTLGESDDTWALNEGVLSEKAFLELSYHNHEEWEKMLFNALDNTKKGVVASWFETTDSIQHMFFRYLDKNHPSLNNGQGKMSVKVIEDLYRKMDKLIEKVMDKLYNNDVLIVMSDHGFKLFRRGFNLNSWLYKNKYLYLKNGKKESDEWFKDVNWSKTKAYGLGLAGIYINQKGRESQGTVNSGKETTELKNNLIQKLNGLKDDKTGDVAINKIFDRDKIPAGPYKENCPDFIVGYNEGYRVSWDSVVGKVNSSIFEDNTKSWSGDHCIDPRIVPGIFFCNKKINNKTPSIIDIAPTALKLFGLNVPPHMDGHSLIDGKGFQTNKKIRMDSKK